MFLLVYLLAFISIGIAQIPTLLQLFTLAVLLCFAFLEYRSVEPDWHLHWNLQSGVISIARGSGSLETCVGIEQLYLVFGMLYLRLNRQHHENIHLLIFPDSVERHSYRRLRGAARWINIRLKSE